MRNFFRYILVIKLLVTFQTESYSQQSTNFLLSPSGGHAELKTAGIELDWTVGEIAIENTRLINGSVKMGFLQSLAMASKRNRAIVEPESIICYPNPVSRKISLVCEKWDNAELRIEVKNPAMETVLPGQSYSKVVRKIVLDLTILPAGPYYIIVTNLQNKTTISQAVIKIN